MARLKARGRKRIARKNFAGKGRSYPIHDKAHAQAALRMAARKNTKGSYAGVKRKVCRKYPGLATCKRGRK